MKSKNNIILLLAAFALLAAGCNRYEVGVEWINTCDPCGNENLSCRDDVAEGFYTILTANGYEGLFNFGNASAWERDFKEPNDQNWVDAADIVMHADHGGPCRFVFGETTHDDCRLWGSEAQWGNQDLEWIILDDCSCLRSGQYSCWYGAFQGLHLICSFDTNAHDSCSRGTEFANKLVAGWTVVQAWFYAGEVTEGASTDSAILGAVKGSEDPYFDHIHKFGTVSKDPYPVDYWWWASHNCD